MNILLIEDDASTRALLTMILERANNSVVEAEDGKKALQYLSKQKADLILTDIYMPEMNGLDFLAELRKSSATADVPVILCTCVSNPKILAQAEKLGVRAVVPKPVNPSLLLQKIAQMQTTGLPVLEDSKLTVQRLGVDVKGYYELLNIMVENAVQRLMDVKEGIEKGELNGFESFLRDLYSSAESLGAKALSHAAMVASMVIPDAEKALCDENLRNLKAEIERLQSMVLSLKEKNGQKKKTGKMAV